MRNVSLALFLSLSVLPACASSSAHRTDSTTESSSTFKLPPYSATFFVGGPLQGDRTTAELHLANQSLAKFNHCERGSNVGDDTYLPDAQGSWDTCETSQFRLELDHPTKNNSDMYRAFLSNGSSPSAQAIPGNGYEFSCHVQALPPGGLRPTGSGVTVICDNPKIRSGYNHHPAAGVNN